MRVNIFSRRVWVSSWVMLTLGCACGAQAVRAGGAGSGPRGQVTVRGPSVRAVTVGPMVLHAFSGFPGGALYTAPAVTGTDQDCNQRERIDEALARGKVAADRRVVLNLDAGEVACLVTQNHGSFELLWHATVEAPPPGAKVATAPAR
jgi:hypothetical protein